MQHFALDQIYFRLRYFYAAHPNLVLIWMKPSGELFRKRSQGHCHKTEIASASSNKTLHNCSQSLRHMPFDISILRKVRLEWVS